MLLKKEDFTALVRRVVMSLTKEQYKAQFKASTKRKMQSESSGSCASANSNFGCGNCDSCPTWDGVWRAAWPKWLVTWLRDETFDVEENKSDVPGLGSSCGRIDALFELVDQHSFTVIPDVNAVESLLKELGSKWDAGHLWAELSYVGKAWTNPSAPRRSSSRAMVTRWMTARLRPKSTRRLTAGTTTEVAALWRSARHPS